MKVTWDFKEWTRFGNKLVDSHNLDTYLMTATQNIARVLHSYLLANTPVDTGNLRKMWSAGDNLRFTVEKIGHGFQVTFINLARRDTGFMYGLAVNDGHRTPSGNGWVTGKFFVERSLLQTGESAKLEKLIMTELQKWFEGCVNG